MVQREVVKALTAIYPEKVTSKELAEAIHLSRECVTRGLSGLVRCGFVEVLPDPEDPRRNYYRLKK